MRKALAKRIIKAVQPHLEAAVRAEADISNKPVEAMLKELEVFLDASLQARRESISVSTAEAVTLGDAEGDLEMADASQPTDDDGVEYTIDDKAPEQQHETNENNEGEGEDAKMQDDDAEHELNDSDTVAVVVVAARESELADVEDTIVAAPLAEVNGNTPPIKSHTSPVKNTSTPPDTNGYVTAPESQQPAPPTPPISNGGHAADNADLNTGGVLWYVKEFQPEGTSIVDPTSSRLSEDLSDMDEEELKVLGVEVNEAGGDFVGTVGVASASKSKKGKAKKRAKSNRW